MSRITTWLASANAICDAWTKENSVEKGTSANIPNYKLVIGERTYGNGMEKVEATTFCIICKDKDGLYLKTLLSEMWKQEEKPRGVSPPAQRDLITSPENYNQLLRNHN
eukprot:10219836-Ditylum_brightwellii.AAC.1